MRKLLKVLGVAVITFIFVVVMVVIAELAKMFPTFGAIITAVLIMIFAWLIVSLKDGKEQNERDI